MRLNYLGLSIRIVMLEQVNCHEYLYAPVIFGNSRKYDL